MNETPGNDHVVLDDSIAEMLPPLPIQPAVTDRLRHLEVERSAAYSQMQRMVVDIGTLKKGSQRWAREMEAAQADVLYRLAMLAEYRSGGGAAKILRTGVMAALLANALGQDEADCDRLQTAAPLLDIGEIALPDSLLSSPALNETERALMRGHCELGHGLLANSTMPALAMAAEIALGHHERFDGSGYPRHLAGQEIPLSCRIVAVVDSFDALTLNRPYRRAYAPAVAVEMILAGTGSLFDPAVVEAFRRIGEAFLQVRWMLDDEKPHPEYAPWLGKPPEPGFWKRFV